MNEKTILITSSSFGFLLAQALLTQDIRLSRKSSAS